MEEFGITPQAPADSTQRDLDHPLLYRDALGNEWRFGSRLALPIAPARTGGKQLDPVN